MWRFVRLIAALSAVLLLPTVPAEACSCAAERSPGESLRSATAVFEGTIVDQRAVLTEVAGSTTAAIVYEVALARMWKGTPSTTVRLLRRGPCDPILRVGRAYLVYAESDERGRLLAAACTRTMSVEHAAEDFLQLGAPAASFEQVPRALPTSLPVNRRMRAYVVAGLAIYVWAFSEPRNALSSAPAALAFVTGLQLCAGLACIVRRRRKPAVLLIAGALVTAAFAVVWSGRRLLQDEWFSAFLNWQG